MVKFYEWLNLHWSHVSNPICIHEGNPENEENNGSSLSPQDSHDPSIILNTNSIYDTKYGKSFRHFTREALPKLENYRNMMSIQAAYRPTLDELHDSAIERDKVSIV